MSGKQHLYKTDSHVCLALTRLWTYTLFLLESTLSSSSLLKHHLSWLSVIEFCSIHICANKSQLTRRAVASVFAQGQVIELNRWLVLVSQPLCWDGYHPRKGDPLLQWIAGIIGLLILIDPMLFLHSLSDWELLRNTLIGNHFDSAGDKCNFYSGKQSTQSQLLLVTFSLLLSLTPPLCIFYMLHKAFNCIRWGLHNTQLSQRFIMR